MDAYIYLYLFLFLVSIYLVKYFNDKTSAKFPKAYIKSDLYYYPTNYNLTTFNSSENKYITILKSEMMIYSIALQYILGPIIKIYSYPKKILFHYIHKMV